MSARGAPPERKRLFECVLQETSSELMVDSKGSTASPLYFWPRLYRGSKECVRDVAKSVRIRARQPCVRALLLELGEFALLKRELDVRQRLMCRSGMLPALLALGGG